MSIATKTKEDCELDEMLEKYVSKYIASLHLAIYAKQRGLQMNNMPDFYDVLAENARNYASPSAIASGNPKGNKHIYGPLPTAKSRGISGKLHYLPSDLKQWFDNYFWPVWSALHPENIK